VRISAFIASSSSAAKTKQRADQQGAQDAERLPPLDPGGAVAIGGDREELVGEAHPDHRADQGVRRRVRQAEGPGAEIPDDRGDQQREDHRVAGAGPDLEHEFDRQQRDDAVGDRPRGDHHAEEVEQARPHHRHRRRQAVGVDHGRDRVGGVVEAVHELEAQRDQQREAEQREGADGERRLPGGVHVGDEAVEGVAEAADEQQHEAGDAGRVDAVVEARPAPAGGRGGRARAGQAGGTGERVGHEDLAG
jgi:hypothetical protein